MRKLLPAIACLLILSTAHAAVTADTTDAYVERNVTTGTSFTTASSVTIASGNNLCLVFVSAYIPSGTGVFASVTWNGQSLTEVGRVFVGGAFDDEVWDIVSPTAGSGTITVTANASAALGGENLLTAVCLSGVNTGTPLGTFASLNSSGDTATVTATGGVSGDLYMGWVSFSGNQASINPTGTGQTQIKSYANTSSNGNVSMDDIPGADAGAFSWGTTTPSGNSVTLALAVAVKAAGGSSCTHTGWNLSTRTFTVPTAGSGSFWHCSGASGSVDCSTGSYWQSGRVCGVN